MFVEFTLIEWDSYMYFSGTRTKTLISTDMIAEVRASQLEQMHAFLASPPPEKWAMADNRHLFRDVRACDLYLLAVNGQARVLTVEGSLEDILMRIEFRS